MDEENKPTVGSSIPDQSFTYRIWSSIKQLPSTLVKKPGEEHYGGESVHGYFDQGGTSTILPAILYNEVLGQFNESKLLACLEQLVATNCVNSKDENGETPLCLAVHNDLELAAMFLVKNGADTSVKSQIFKKNHSLATTIAEKMPRVMEAILNSGVSMELNNENESSPPMLTLDFKPILQHCENHENPTQRETSFLHSLVALDVSAEVQSLYLKHPLVSAFLEMRETQTAFLVLKTVGFIFALFAPILYMCFIFYLYFTHCCDLRNGAADFSEVENCKIEIIEGQPSNLTEIFQEKLYCRKSFSVSILAWFLIIFIGVTLSREILLLFKANRFSNVASRVGRLSKARVASARALEVFEVVTKFLQKNWRSWLAIISLVCMIVPLWPVLWFAESYHSAWHYPVTAAGVWFACTMILIKIEGWWAKTGIYVDILVAVVLAVFKVILFFMPLLFGFYIALKLMFFQVGETIPFILMMVDATQLEELFENPRDSASWFKTMADVSGGAFIVLIPVIFMNFLLGIAIEEIHGVKRDADILFLASQIRNSFYIDLAFPPGILGFRFYSPQLFSPHDAKSWSVRINLGDNQFSPKVCKDLIMLVKSKRKRDENTAI